MQLKPRRKLPSISIVLTIVFISIASLSYFVAPINFTIITKNNSNNVSALTYSNATNLSFNFEPYLNITLSSNSINIDNLVPGNISESNHIEVNVSTNTAYGYSLFASVGSSDSSSPYYNTSDLIHEDTTIDTLLDTPVFQSISTNANLINLNDFEDNTWGYSYRIHNTNNTENEGWSSYNGLPTSTTVDSNTSTTKPALLIDTKDPTNNKSIDFKLAAKASTNQASGEYSNIINFYAVGKPEPPLYMQDVNVIKTKLANKHDTTTVIDQRDGREYTIAKLKDGNIWMTQNLDIKGETRLYSETSDVPEGYSEADSRPYYTLPASSANFYHDNASYLYNVPYSDPDRSFCSVDHPCYSYYSWLTATVGGKDASGDVIYSNDTDAAYSICPKGWRLPSSRSTIAGNSDFYKLALAYGMNVDEISESGDNFYIQAGPGTIPNFNLTGYYFQRAFYRGGENGFYWSSTSKSHRPNADGFSYVLGFSSSGVNSASQGNYHIGVAVRCLVR